MGRAQIKKKSTFIDMTAMSDVTVLLLTFFMLTSTFVKKEPVQVTTPASVSEIKIPETNVLQILVDPEGKIFMSCTPTASIFIYYLNHFFMNLYLNSFILSTTSLRS